VEFAEHEKNLILNKKLVIGIAGLGLIGGSIAWAFKSSDLVEKVIVYERTTKNLAKAIELGVITSESGCELECLRDCDVIFICQPVDIVPFTAAKLAAITSLDGKRRGAMLTDVGSAKSEIMDKVKELGVARFIGGHPMAGSEKVGFGAASPTLLENAIYVVCAGDSYDYSEDVELLELLIKDLGAIPVRMQAPAHDRVVAVISHLPHMLASALCTYAAGESEHDEMVKVLAAGGFKDITRIASSNPDMWTEIALDSRAALLPVMSNFVNEVERLIKAIEAKDSEAICAILEAGRVFRNEVAMSGRGILQGLPEIRVDVSDKPGEIGKVTSLLGENNINIQNINIQHTRAYEGGTMRLTLQNERDMTRARELLVSEGFACHEK